MSDVSSSPSAPLDASDLALNQEGRLSPKQAAAIRFGLATYTKSAWTFRYHQWAALDDFLYDDLRLGRVLNEEGVIEASNHDPQKYFGWIARGPSWPQPMSLNAGLAVLPGRYRLYYLSHSHMVVNVEPLDPAQTYPTSHQALLDQVHQADPRTRSKNQQGSMTDAQRDWVRQWSRGPRNLSMMLGGALALQLFVVFGMLLSLPSPGDEPWLPWWGLLLLLTPSLLLGPFLLPRVRQYASARSAAAMGTVRTIEGSIERSLVWTGRHVRVVKSCLVTVGGTTYELPPNLWLVLVDGLHYRLAVPEKTLLVVGAELVATP